ncbi:MAG: hypothetical protein COA91_00360 [Robiginitomaculum sp.]|nr:MAG: hypothetical protein COA91_00360 [Robiginitomaculum sp.]
MQVTHVNLKPFTRTYAVLAILLLLFMATIAQGEEVKSAAFLKAQSLMKVENYKAAAKTITKAQKNGEDTIDMSLMLTNTYAARIGQVGALKKLGLAKKIKASTEHSLKLDPNHIGALEGLIQFHLQAPGIAGGDKDEARKLAARMIVLKPVRGHVLLATLSAKQEKFAEAEQHINKALAIDPTNTQTLLAKASGLGQQERYIESITVFETCLEHEPENQDCRYLIGKTAQVAKIEYEKGKAAFAKFIEIGHDNKEYIAYAHYRLGKIYAQTDDETTAKTHYQLAVNIADLKPAKKALAAME